MSNFIFILLYMTIGFIFQKVKLPVKTPHLKLNKFLIYVALPAMILLETPKIAFSTNSMIPVYIAWATMIMSALLVYFASKRYQFTREVTGALMLVTVLTNSTFVGIPVITAYFGVEALPFIVLYDQLGTSLWLAVYATIIAVYYSSKGDVSFKIITLKIMRFPPLIAFVIAVTFNQYTYPDLLTSILELLVLTIVPFALISVGLQLEFKLETSEVKPFVVSLVIKLILSPMLAIFICYIFGWQDLLIGKVSIMEAGMAAMITAGVIASMNGLAPRLSNAIVAYGIALSFVTSWILYMIIV